MEILYVLIGVFLFGFGYLLGAWKAASKIDGHLYAGTDPDGDVRWIGMKLNDSESVYSKNYVLLDVIRKDYKSYSEEDKRND